MIERRALLIGMAATVAAPSIVRASALMPIKVIQPSVANIDRLDGFSFQALWNRSGEIHQETIIPERTISDVDNGHSLLFKLDGDGEMLGVKAQYTATHGLRGVNTVWIPKLAMTADNRAILLLQHI